MAYIPKALVDGVTLTTSEVELYTVPEDYTATIVSEIRLINNNASERDVTVYFKSSGDDAELKNLALQTTIMNKIPGIFYSRTVLPPGSVISALASAGTSVSIRISGAEVP